LYNIGYFEQSNKLQYSSQQSAVKIHFSLPDQFNPPTHLQEIQQFKYSAFMENKTYK